MINYKRQILIAIIFLVTAFQCLGQVEGLRSDVAFLADSVGSRYPGSEGDFKVRKHIAGRFSDCGLEYSEETFDIVDRIWGEGSLRLVSGDTVTDFTQGNDFIVRGRSASDSLSAEYVVVLDSLPDTSLGLLCGKVAVSPGASKAGHRQYMRWNKTESLPSFMSKRQERDSAEVRQKEAASTNHTGYRCLPSTTTHLRCYSHKTSPTH